MTETEKKENEHQNEQVHFTVHRKPQAIVEYEVEVFPAILKETYSQAVKTVGKEVSFPGFRKGKAPEDVVMKRHPGEIDKKWQDLIANTAFKECDRLAKIPLLRRDTTISYKMHKHSMESAKLTLSFETTPVIPSVDPKKFQLKAIERPEVNDEKVEETIRQTQLFFSKWTLITDRPIKEGDFVLLDVDVIDEAPPQKLFSDTRFEVTDRSMAKWMKELILGKKAGESVEGTSVPDEDLKPEEKEAFKPKKVRIYIKAIEEAALPPLDEQFAKQMGVESIDQMRQRVTELLNKQADEHVHEKQREQVTDFLLTAYPFDLPRSVIERETQFRMQQIAKDPQFQKNWNAMSESERRNFVTSVMSQAEKAVRIFYLCRKIIQDANINITVKDVPAPITDPLEAILKPGAQMHDPNEPDVKQAEAYSRVILEKAEDWILQHAQEPVKKSGKKSETVVS